VSAPKQSKAKQSKAGKRTRRQQQQQQQQQHKVSPSIAQNTKTSPFIDVSGDNTWHFI